MQFRKSHTLHHYNVDCQELEGVACEARPFCKVMGTRKYIQKHEETCPNIKVECSRCQTLVIRAKIYTHDCFTSLHQKL